MTDHVPDRPHSPPELGEYAARAVEDVRDHLEYSILSGAEPRYWDAADREYTDSEQHYCVQELVRKMLIAYHDRTSIIANWSHKDKAASVFSDFMNALDKEAESYAQAILDDEDEFARVAEELGL